MVHRIPFPHAFERGVQRRVCRVHWAVAEAKMTYGDRAFPVWWDKHHGKLERFDNLTIVHLPGDSTEALAALADRSMSFQVTIQDGEVTFSNDNNLVSITPEQRLPQN